MRSATAARPARPPATARRPQGTWLRCNWPRCASAAPWARPPAPRRRAAVTWTCYDGCGARWAAPGTRRPAARRRAAATCTSWPGRTSSAAPGTSACARPRPPAATRTCSRGSSSSAAAGREPRHQGGCRVQGHASTLLRAALTSVRLSCTPPLPYRDLASATTRRRFANSKSKIGNLIQPKGRVQPPQSLGPADGAIHTCPWPGRPPQIPVEC
mmetsp:Transcript_29917/g.76741  ORF Transcript_29917/g.76741 Transcript_29917/m.76741 type:complete len:214 (+) Transcript_29917:839-1480(+)